MLYYSSIYPERDYFDSFSKSDQGLRISELLEGVALNHSRNTLPCFSTLESLGIILGNGGFETILIQRDPLGPVSTVDAGWAKSVVAAAKKSLVVPLWYCFSIGCRIYVLICLPRLREGDPEADATGRRIYDSCVRMNDLLKPDAPTLRIILSDFEYGETGVFRNFNKLHHAMEYYDFRTVWPSPIQISTDQQLHGAFIGDLSAYRQFSVSVAEQLSRDDLSTEAVANTICDAILQNSGPSMESIHHHVQIFMLTFTEYLGSSGLVDASYLSRHQIVHRAMGFETEAQLRGIMLELIEELHRQNRTLRSVGRQKRIQSIREYVEQSITNPDLTVAHVSEAFGLSTTHIAKQFRYYYGVSLHRFIQQTRYRLAETLLSEHPDWPVHKIAEAAGYSDLSTMYRAFRTLGNVTPGALRDALQQTAQSEVYS